MTRAARKRSLLTTESRLPSSVDGDREKEVKSKKRRANTPPAVTKRETRSSTADKKTPQYKCSVCKIPFLNVLIRDYHEKAAHEDQSEPDAQILDVRPLGQVIKAGSPVAVALESVKLEPETGRSIENIDIGEPEEPAISYTCHFCGRCCKRKDDLRRHIFSIHMLSAATKMSPSGLLICAICEQSFENKTSLKRHVETFHFRQTYGKSASSWIRGYCCDMCGEGFLTANKMLAHRDVSHIDAPFMTWKMFRNTIRKARVCSKCDRSWARGSFFQNHICKSVDPELATSIENALKAKPVYQCDLCSLCFVWKLTFRQHRENVHPNVDALNWESISTLEIKHYCTSCYVAFDDESKIADHHCVNSEEDLQPKLNRCDICGGSYARKSDFLRHQRIKHPDLFAENGESDSGVSRKKPYISCAYCGSAFSTRNGILAHIREEHKVETDSPFVCILCNKLFKRKATMDAHNQVYHPKEENAEETEKILKDAEMLLNGESAYHCNICNRNMLSSLRFLAHYRLHFIERKYTCDLCGKQTRTQHQLNSHIKIIHLNIRKFECDICGKCFHARQSCEEHRRIHTGERPFSCEICGKTFIAMNALFTHKKFHNDFFAHPCSMCDKKFKVRRSLINHIRTHTGERPFKCELCPKTFNNSSRFSYHKKVTHSDARPFTCVECGSCFKANKFLMRHMKLHKVRTQIQFRRRNNPAYFAANGSNKGSKGASSKKREEQSGDRQGVILLSGDSSIAEGVYSLQEVDSGSIDIKQDICIANVVGGADVKDQYFLDELKEPERTDFSSA